MKKDDIVREATESGEEIDFDKTHSIIFEKHLILDEDDPRRKFKDREDYLGNQMIDQSNEIAIFSDLRSSPASPGPAPWSQILHRKIS